MRSLKYDTGNEAEDFFAREPNMVMLISFSPSEGGTTSLHTTVDISDLAILNTEFLQTPVFADCNDERKRDF